jgi:threonine aldolase
MPEPVVDLRSDTVTKPTAAMRRAIAEAEVGDDVFHDDPSVLALERRVADLLGKDDAMYVPSGTMANQAALRVHTQPGDVVLAPADAHVHIHEMGAPYVLSGVTIQFVDGERGTFRPADVAAAIPRPSPSMPASLFQPITLVWVENTHNSAGGAVWPPDLLASVTAEAKRLRIATHMDGARLWNAAIATGRSEAELAAGFDTVSVCFSKGLGAPMGSALVGRQDLIDRARFFKQMFGGGFRQAGLMAAAARHAVDHHRPRLADDHANASRLATGLAEIPGIAVDAGAVETNMVYFDVVVMPADELVQRCADKAVLMLPMSVSRIRAVANLDVDTAGIDRALAVIEQAVASS